MHERDDMEGLDAAILMNRLVWKYSGHEATFSDPMIDCRNCKARPRADHVFVAQKGRDPKGIAEINAAIDAKELKCPKCGSTDLTEARPFNLMFKTTVGAVDTGDDSGLAYLRPETAQGMFVNFGNVLDTMSRKLPFGIAQIGKAFRNEITPGNFTFRTREFEQMEIEYFVKPGEDEAAHQEWMDERQQWYLDLGMRRENLREREQTKDELAHYAKRCVDLEYRFPMGWSELEGIANRTDYDLQGAQPQREEPRRGRRADLLRPGAEAAHRPLRHRAVGRRRPRHAGLPVRRLRGRAGEGAAGRGAPPSCASWWRASSSRRPSATTLAKDVKDAPGRRGRGHRRRAAGLAAAAAGPDGGHRGQQDRGDEEAARASGRRSPRSTRARCCTCTRAWRPSRVAVFPLEAERAALVETARGIRKELRQAGLRAVYDDTGAIGKLYRRQDEIGTPWCITVDFQTQQDGTVTVRDRDTMEQERVPAKELPAALSRAMR